MTPRTKPSSCIGCSCYSMGSDFSQPEGTGALRVMLLGEASGENEARDQLPFRPYARAGQILERTLRRLGLNRQQFVISNCLRCRPRNNLLEGMAYEMGAIQCCAPNLAEVISRYRPRVIVPLGNIPLRTITGLAGPDRGIGNLRGYVLPTIFNGVVALPTFHPAFIGRGAQYLMGVLARDILRAIAVAQGKDASYILNPQREHKGYITHPTAEQARALRGMLHDNPDWPISFDLETYESTSLEEDQRTGFTDTEIRLIQFSYKPGYGMAMPWKEPFKSIAAAILALPNPKLGHNINHFDLKVLKAAGARMGLNLWPNGPLYDTLDMFRTWQPDLPANLQFAASFASFPFPWKHLSGSDLEFYGCADVDSTLRLAGAAQKAMRGFTHPLSGLTLWDGYERSVYSVRPVLRDMEDRGLPVDDAERVKLGAEFDAAEQELDAELDRRCPQEVKNVHPKEGYKKNPKDTSNLVLKTFTVAALEGAGEPATKEVVRWCRVEPFSKNSSQQLLRYMRAKGHVPPKDAKKISGETTAAKELVRLADKTTDNFYLKVIECREFGKMKGTYVEGFRPARDGRVHTSFTFDTATWQLAAKNPNVVNIPKHGRLAPAIRKMFRAPAGYEFSEWDFKSYHVLTTGFNAESAQYMRLARLDMHSFVANEFLRAQGQKGLENADRLFVMKDEELAAYLKWFKSDPARKRTRDEKSKRAILGIGFGMQPRKLYLLNREFFGGLRDAEKLFDVIRALFPEVFEWQDRVKQLAHQQTYLQSRFGNIRWFYEVFVWDNKRGKWIGGEQAEQAVAFLPSTEAFGNIRECLKEINRLGWDKKYGLCNTVHDSLVFLYPKELREEHLSEIYEVLHLPSKILIHPKLAPNGLIVDSECVIGDNLASMEEIDVGALRAAKAAHEGASRGTVS